MRRFQFPCVVAVATLVVSAPPVLAQDRAVTYSRDVAPILREHCVTCHRPGQFAPFTLTTYDEAAAHARRITEVTQSRVMPPWMPEEGFGEFRGERHLPESDIETLARWVQQGMLEGDRDIGVPALPATDAWQLGEPDLVVQMPEPFAVPADGADVFHNFVIPVPITTRKFVRAVEFRPGHAMVIHHARFLIDDSGEARRADEAEPGPGYSGMENHSARFPDGHFLGWASGKTPTVDPLAWPIDPGTDMVLQMHFKPMGTPETVRASLALYFSDTPPAITPIALHLGSQTIDIPAGESQYVVADAYTLPVDVTALRIYPHAHYLAVEMDVSATLPDGRVEPLLRIPDWDFHWQDEYEFARPVALPKGSTVRMRYVYNNSAGNPDNPSRPPVRVRYGPEATDEMGDLIVQLLPRSDREGQLLRAELARKELLIDIAGGEQRVSEGDADIEIRNKLAVDYVRAGRLPDALAQFEALLAIEPRHATANYNLGVIALEQRQYEMARMFFGRALVSRPHYPEARTNYGVLLQLEGDESGAMEQYRLAIEENPYQDTAHFNLGRALAARGDMAEAVDHFESAVGAKPNSVDYLTSLAWLLATAPDPDQRRPGQAVAYATKANTLSGGRDAAVLDALAAAYAADGRFDRAVAVARTAYQRALAANNVSLSSQIRDRMTRYEDAAAGDARPGP